MNKELLKPVLTFILGAASGSVVTYYIVSKIKEQEKREEIASVKEVYRKVNDEKIAKIGELTKKVAEDEDDLDTYNQLLDILDQCGYAIQAEGQDEPTVITPPDEIKKKIEQRRASRKQEKSYDEEAEEFVGPAEETTEEDEETKTGIVELSEAIRNRPMNNKPFVIDQDEFVNGMPAYDKLTITFYGGDDTLVDDHDEIMQYDIVGQEAINMIKDEAGPDVVYVRNDGLAIDYEIIFVEAGFAEVNGEV